MEKGIFLKARWINLLMLNYEVDPEILRPHIPHGTELDLWQGKALVSMVGFLFMDTYVKGFQFPFHVNFEEVNLRFYVKRFDGIAWKRGTVFISEIVPKPIIALIANVIYKEHYSAMPMRHSLEETSDGNTRYLYEWKFDGRWSNRLGGTVKSGDMHPILPGSQEEFILEHYWGYNKVNKSKTFEYGVEHITWNAANVIDPVFEAEIGRIYGKEFVPYLEKQPYSAFFADGSDILVRGISKYYADPILL